MSLNWAGQFLSPWVMGKKYAVSQVVLDRGGFWYAVAANVNSRPISGNANWTLVGGTPYVDVVLSPIDLTTAPLFANPFIGVGFSVVPAPGVGLAAFPAYLAT